MTDPQQPDLDLLAASLVEEPDTLEPFDDEPNGSLDPGARPPAGG